MAIFDRMIFCGWERWHPFEQSVCVVEIHTGFLRRRVRRYRIVGSEDLWRYANTGEELPTRWQIELEGRWCVEEAARQQSHDLRKFRGR